MGKSRKVQSQQIPSRGRSRLSSLPADGRKALQDKKKYRRHTSGVPGGASVYKPAPRLKRLPETRSHTITHLMAVILQNLPKAILFSMKDSETELSSQSKVKHQILPHRWNLKMQAERSCCSGLQS